MIAIEDIEPDEPMFCMTTEECTRVHKILQDVGIEFIEIREFIEENS